jgi:pimeloyl-ACP methyl ester carboxylesterase
MKTRRSIVATAEPKRRRSCEQGDAPGSSGRDVAALAYGALVGLPLPALTLALACWAGMAVAGAATVEPVLPCFATPAPEVAIDVPIDCGYVVVPQKPDAPNGPMVKLGFVRLAARGPRNTAPPPRKAAPLFMLAGGPGGSLIDAATFGFFRPEFLGPILDRRDVVILEQRGTRHAVPVLDCDELSRLGWARYSRGLGPAQGEALEREVLERCIGEFGRQGVDLSTYNSVTIAADLDAARTALGYDRIVYYGASYGAQLGQHVMRDFPGMLEAVILDGANSLSRKSWIEDRALDVDYSIRHMTALCAADAGCRAAFDIPSLIERGLKLFDEGPIAASHTDPKDPSTTLKFDVRESDFAALVYQFQGSNIGVMALPLTLKTLVDGGRASMGAQMGRIIGTQVLASRSPPSGALATLMHMAVVCSDDPVRSVDELILDGASRYARVLGMAAARDYVRYCNIVGVPSLPDATDVNVESTIPTLILSGGLDAQTPTFRSELVARTLPNARLVVFPDGTHVQLGAINLCAGRIMVAFVADPAGPLPLECARTLRFPGFLLPEVPGNTEAAPAGPR